MSLVVQCLRSPLLHDCNLTISDGEIVALHGASGSGKTAFLRAIADLDPNEGEVWLDDVPRASISGPEWRRQVRFIAAEPGWWTDRVSDHFRNPKEATRVAIEIGLPPESLDWQVARLSSGEKQRLGLLRALEDEPRALLLDEPTAALDPDAECAVEQLIGRLQSKDVAVLLVTHSDDQAARLSSRRHSMQDGRLIDEL